MLFNSTGFIFVFIPVVVIGFLLLVRAGRGGVALWLLLAASYVFYGWAEPSLVMLLAASTLFNYAVGKAIVHAVRTARPRLTRGLLWLGVGVDLGSFVLGLSIFAIGLIKKVVIADQMAPFADAVFDHARTNPLGALDAWSGALAYTFQIYFDFSGYSDMAVGLSLLFGIRLPVNFRSPYRATSIIEFWRRWHITLSRFLRDYLYIPLGGNRLGGQRRYVNLMVTMLLGGLWHGAAWNFFIWGGLHGLYLCINHLWRGWRGEPKNPALPAKALGWVITFFAVVIAWVFFRARTAVGAWQMLGSLFGFEAGISAYASPGILRLM